MRYQLHTSDDPSVPYMWVLKEDDPRSNEKQVLAVNVASAPPDNHLWKIVVGTEKVWPRNKLEASHKSIDVE